MFDSYLYQRQKLDLSSIIMVSLIILKGYMSDGQNATVFEYCKKLKFKIKWDRYFHCI